MLVGYMRVSTAEQNLALTARPAAGGWHRAGTHLRRYLLWRRHQPPRICPRPGVAHEALCLGSISSVRIRIIPWLWPNCLIVREENPLRAVTRAVLGLEILSFSTAGHAAACNSFARPVMQGRGRS